MAKEKISKRQLKEELLGRLASDLAALERAHLDAQAGATHEEAKSEDDKDTRALEQTYLARGQAQRVEDLRAAVAEVQALHVPDFAANAPVGLGALISVDEAGKTLCFFLAPQSGGTMLAGGKVQVVTPKSPLGQTLLGAYEGDDCDLDLPTGTRSFSILAVR